MAKQGVLARPDYLHQSPRSIDVDRLHWAGYLQPGWGGGRQWTRGGKRIAWINLCAEGRPRASLIVRNPSALTPPNWPPPSGGPTSRQEPAGLFLRSPDHRPRPVMGADGCIYPRTLERLALTHSPDRQQQVRLTDRSCRYSDRRRWPLRGIQAIPAPAPRHIHPQQD
jgi:hypothetical protein